MVNNSGDKLVKRLEKIIKVAKKRKIQFVLMKDIKLNNNQIITVYIICV